jgi:hypothetical protein
MARNRTTLFDTPPDQLSAAEARSELKELADLIADHDRFYHEMDQPEITDGEYDALRQRNAAIEARFPALIRPDSPDLRTVFGYPDRQAPGPLVLPTVTTAGIITLITKPHPVD